MDDPFCCMVLGACFVPIPAVVLLMSGWVNEFISSQPPPKRRRFIRSAILFCSQHQFYSLRKDQPNPYFDLIFGVSVFFNLSCDDLQPNIVIEEHHDRTPLSNYEINTQGVVHPQCYYRTQSSPYPCLSAIPVILGTPHTRQRDPHRCLCWTHTLPPPHCETITQEGGGVRPPPSFCPCPKRLRSALAPVSSSISLG
jgi:hypothetical protein